MGATVILIDSEAELARARALVDRLWDSNDPADIGRLEAQAHLIAAYEERKWPRRPPSIADLLRHLMDQHGLTRADMVPILGTPSRVSEVLRGKKGLNMAMVQRLRPLPCAGRHSHSTAQESVRPSFDETSRSLILVFGVVL